MTEQPKRIQLSRKKGWRLPPNTVVVSRPSKWGNPFKIGDTIPGWLGPVVADRKRAVEMHELHLTFNLTKQEDIRAELRGKNLACWCPLDQPCHADTLLRIANS